jgi:arylsulfatase A-like enzyme
MKYIHTALLLALPTSVHAADAVAAEKPAITSILADDLGIGRLSSCGVEHLNTPSKDRLAASGIRFEHGYSSLLCRPSPALRIDGATSQMPHENDLNGSTQ